MSSESWSAAAVLPPFWVLHWSPEEPHLDGSPDVVAEVESLLDGADDLLVTPTGPVVPSTPADPLAVLAALVRVRPGGRFATVGPAPEIPSVPEGATA